MIPDSAAAAVGSHRRWLAAQLAQRASCHVEMISECSSPADPARGDATTLRWWDGPTTLGMRRLSEQYRMGGSTGPDEVLRFDRRHTSWGRAWAVLVWLDLDPGARLRLSAASVARIAAEQIGQDHRCDPIWRPRAASLLISNRNGRRFTLSTLTSLMHRARVQGWEPTGEWLDTAPGRRLQIVR
ncbi:hypothetical protein ACWEKT_34300 [Nocardia takedensis]